MNRRKFLKGVLGAAGAAVVGTAAGELATKGSYLAEPHGETLNQFPEKIFKNPNDDVADAFSYIANPKTASEMDVFAESAGKQLAKTFDDEFIKIACEYVNDDKSVTAVFKNGMLRAL